MITTADNEGGNPTVIGYHADHWINFMFNSSQEIAFNLSALGKPGEIVCRFPTDEEWLAWRRKRRVVQHRVPGGTYRTEEDTPKPCDVNLLNSIRIDKGGRQATPFEAFRIVRQLSHCGQGTAEVVKEGAAYSVLMRVMHKLDTVHVFRSPTTQELVAFQHQSSDIFRSKIFPGRQEVQINFEAGAQLYDATVLRTEGYIGAVPVVHKAEAANFLVQHLRSELER